MQKKMLYVRSCSKLTCKIKVQCWLLVKPKNSCTLFISNFLIKLPSSADVDILTDGGFQCKKLLESVPLPNGNVLSTFINLLLKSFLHRLFIWQ